VNGGGVMLAFFADSWTFHPASVFVSFNCNNHKHRDKNTMKCPICPETDLVMTERQGVEIDYCPKCRGVWLDRGELDKIIERSASGAYPQARVQPDDIHRGHYPDHSDEHRNHERKGHNRKRSWLQELFD
jgi:Zn-finger nucleic acid-binding protein